MYNRYIPRDDGSYHRNRVSEIKSQPQQKPHTPNPAPQEPPPAVTPQPAVASQPVQNIGGFLRQLLPKQLETADLVVLLLLLLMAGDNEEERSNALLTMALYFIL